MSDANNTPTHQQILDEIKSLRDVVHQNANDIAVVSRTITAHTIQYDQDRIDDEPIRQFHSDLGTITRLGGFVRSALGWLVLVAGGGVLLFEYAVDKLNR